MHVCKFCDKLLTGEIILFSFFFFLFFFLFCLVLLSFALHFGSGALADQVTSALLPLASCTYYGPSHKPGRGGPADAAASGSEYVMRLNV